ncbi:uncharacterized protein LOC134672629 isoform X2 [Cydia fagiglandana]|uniref:uncharacterized protein LOC134672629 isoform X2 n=1 Tax=Cydia fagiglandana TaxID=1458189 RepID=UPI002FEE048B
MLKFLVSALLASTCVQYATAIRCYDCTSVNNTMCLDPSSYDQETLRRFLVFAECGQGVIVPQNYFCRKIVQTIYHTNRESEFRITRGCGWVRAPQNLDCYKADNHDHLETVCQCFEDGCNGATPMVPGWAMFVASVVLMLIKLC